eukprot:SAG31_NODE_758_length_12292_cov_14.175511_6_plen_153_part_00
MQKSYVAHGGESHLCVRVEMPHSHSDGWAPKEIAGFADHILGVENSQPLPTVIESGCTEDGAMLTCTVQCSGAPLKTAELCYTRADGYWADRKYNRQQVERSLWSSAGDKVFLKVPVPSGCVAFLTLTDEDGMLCSTPHVDTRNMAKWAASL